HFSFLIPLHARFPFFPYTTLFRSLKLQHHVLVSGPRHILIASPGAARPNVSRSESWQGSPKPRPQATQREQVVLQCRLPAVQSVDRKSTRLNSSHVKISYAVFCLK